MTENQKGIYYVTGESKKSVQSSPFLEKLKKKDIEVLYLVDPIDEYAVQQLKEYEGKKMISVTKEGLELEDDEEEKKKFEESKKETEELCKIIKETLDDKVDTVVISPRLADSPCILVTGEYGWSANMERIMKAQALGGKDFELVIKNHKTLELNINHQLIIDLINSLNEPSDSIRLKPMIEMLFNISSLESGFTIDSLPLLCKRLYEGLNLDIINK